MGMFQPAMLVYWNVMYLFGEIHLTDSVFGGWTPHLESGWLSGLEAT